VRVSLVGDSGVGKTALVARLRFGSFDVETAPTVGALFAVVRFPEQGGTYHLWDTAGTEKNGSYIPQKLKSSDAVVLVFDVTDGASFVSLTSWVTIIREYCPDESRLIIVGNKLDCARVVSEDSGRQFAEEVGAQYAEVSVKTADGFDALTQLLAAVQSPPLPDLVLEEPPAPAESGCC
jgi:small GTP-binding protein